MNISKFYFLSCLLLALKCQNLNVGLNNPLLLNQQHSGIITISYDY